MGCSNSSIKILKESKEEKQVKKEKKEIKNIYDNNKKEVKKDNENEINEKEDEESEDSNFSGKFLFYQIMVEFLNRDEINYEEDEDNLVSYPKMSFLDLCNFLELEIDNNFMKKKKISIDDILIYNDEKIKRISNELKYFRSVNLLVLCNNESQMKLMAKFYRKIIPNINYSFSCCFDSPRHDSICFNLNLFSVSKNNIILIPLSNLSSDTFEKLNKYKDSILHIFAYHYGEHKLDDSFLPKSLECNFIFSNKYLILLFKSIMENNIPIQNFENYFNSNQYE